MGWRNKRNYDDYWPTADSNGGLQAESYAAYRLRYITDEHGDRVSNLKANEEDTAEQDILILGDSSAFGLGVEGQYIFSELLNQIPGYSTRNLSVVGYTCKQLAKKLKDLDIPQPESATTVIWCGINNIIHGIQKTYWGRILDPTIENDYFSLISLAKERSSRVVLVTIPYHTLGEKYDNKLRNFNQFIRKTAESSGDFQLIDLEKKFISTDNNNISLYAEIDQLIGVIFHPSDHGHKIIAQEIASSLNPRPTKALPFFR